MDGLGCMYVQVLARFKSVFWRQLPDGYVAGLGKNNGTMELIQIGVGRSIFVQEFQLLMDYIKYLVSIKYKNTM